VARSGIARQIVLLVAGAVLAATMTLFLVTFQGPPPMAAPVSLDEVARTLTGERPALPDGQTPVIVAQRPVPKNLTLQTAATHDLAWRLPGETVAVFAHEQAGGPPGRNEMIGAFTAGLALPDGRWRVVSVPEAPLFTSWHRVTLAAMLATFVVVLVAAMFVARAIARPLAEVAEAAKATDDAGVGPHLPAYGPAEVARMAEAVTAMRGRLSDAIDARTVMLLGIAHDLGTPLNRLAFRAQALDEADRQAAQAEIDGMRAMLARVLDFARDGVDAPHEVIELDRLVAATARRAGLVAREMPITLTGDALALDRLFANLFENAQVYGGGAITIDMAMAGDVARVEVADRGPGIDPKLLPTLFEPFVRGEKSRNRETGGSGLGLAIARRIAERHGGTIMAANREGGGATFTVLLPVG
jgi:two-component system, OmpR family, sensor kinase